MGCCWKECHIVKLIRSQDFTKSFFFCILHFGNFIYFLKICSGQPTVEQTDSSGFAQVQVQWHRYSCHQHLHHPRRRSWSDYDQALTLWRETRSVLLVYFGRKDGGSFQSDLHQNVMPGCRTYRPVELQQLFSMFANLPVKSTSFPLASRQWQKQSLTTSVLGSFLHGVVLAVPPCWAKRGLFSQPASGRRRRTLSCVRLWQEKPLALALLSVLVSCQREAKKKHPHKRKSQMAAVGFEPTPPERLEP